MDDQAERVERALRYIAEHYAEPIDLDRLAAVACLSRFHFSRLFSAYRGVSPMEELARMRIERAAEILRFGGQRVADVAFACGYGSLSAFQAAFKARTGLAPGTYRKAKKSKPQDVSSKPPVERGAAPEHAAGTEFQRKVLSMNVSLKDMSPVEIAFVAKKGSYLETRSAWDALLAWAIPRGLAGPAQSFIGIPEDDPFSVPAEECRFRACVTLPVGFEKKAGPVEYGRLAGGLHAVHEFYDTVDRIPFGYGIILRDWMPRSGYQFDADRPCLEVCLNDPADDPQGKARVRICVPVAGGV